jgi:LysR family transcriptional regulator, glycine cleavage system transcriptional activator
MEKLPPLVELRAFDAAARHLSFKKAAEELRVTPTAISHQIRLLERYCGCALFRRRPRPLSLTDPGARLFPAIRSGLEAFAAAIAAISREGNQQESSGDNDKCICQPLARSSFARMGEATSDPSRGDRHR